MPTSKKPSVKETAEEAFLAFWLKGPCRSLSLEREHKFAPTRKWKFDFAYLPGKVAVEIEGRGRHQTIAGFRNDAEKYNTAVEMGWRILRFPATDIKRRNEWQESVLEHFVEQVCRVIVYTPLVESLGGPHSTGQCGQDRTYQPSGSDPKPRPASGCNQHSDPSVRRNARGLRLKPRTT